MTVQKIQDKVFASIRSIPQGKVMTYGVVAQLTGAGNPRRVGQILHQNTDPVTIPCHRVVFADGSLSKHYAFGDEPSQRAKLKQERVVFLANGRVDLQKSLYSVPIQSGSSKSLSSFFKDAT